jgi:hypothetical protein
MADRQNITAALNRLATAEEQFLASRFLAPVVGAGRVQVRIAGVRCLLLAQPRGFRGWGVFRPLSHGAAELVRPGQLVERRRYLDLFPALPAVLCRPDGDGWLALPAHLDQRFRIEGRLRVELPDEVDLFETVVTRFDGSCFWFDQPDPRADPGAGAYLRECFSRMLEPGMLARRGLTAQQVAAYAAAYERRLRRQRADRRQQAEHRLRAALAHAGGRLHDFAERDDVYRVTYEVDGQRHTSIVGKGDLTVQSAGICLSGQDQDFDLHSLVGVLREGRQQRLFR